ncbi:Ger(x)C family spore germination protein [Paenibacillus sp. CGMCC 1.16610]|uniref:Ger(X)C family spore germination protein n=1 Tax=Paenibacillus anseongense TaxID=2682845 RepID=A0ABW9UE74_9BACL|nr:MULTISPECIES: Ger(x)C family spore germination protein [Paenibacillus]MBA2943668.1 Ger(x)C family spore germination protein [Paenibacillus sp. CGMCC 1.16610]MVQ37574.1 Ger(x)C family spore germination protein [Paenibacillus anseongense]
MLKIKVLTANLLLLSLFLLTGCWDSKNITEMSIVVGEAIDQGDEAPKEDKLDEKGGGYRKQDLITITWQVVIPKIAASRNASGDLKPYKNHSLSGDMIHQFAREVSLESKPLFNQHQKMFVFGEKLVRSMDLQTLIDQHFRDNEVRESGLVLIARGLAKDTLESKSPEIPVDRLVRISKNQYRSTRILPSMTIQNVMEKIATHSSFLIQSVAASQGEVKFAGAAVFKQEENKLIGFLSEEELEGLTWLTGKSKGGVVKTTDEGNHPFIIYELESLKSRIQPKVSGDRISFHVDIDSVGRLTEDWREKVDYFDNSYLQSAEKAAEKEVARHIDLILHTMQSKYSVEVAGFGTQLRIHYPKVWQKVKQNWDQEFSKIPVTYSVKLKINDYGLRRMKK